MPHRYAFMHCITWFKAVVKYTVSINRVLFLLKRFEKAEIELNVMVCALILIMHSFASC